MAKLDTEWTPDRPLADARREAFAQALAVTDGEGSSQADAYRKAGYEAHNEASVWNGASRLIRNDEVKARVEHLRQQAAQDAGVTAAWVLERLKETAERCLQHEPVRDRKGEPTGEYRFDSAGACRALELLGKHLGMFKEQLEVDDKRQATLKTQEELAKLPAAELSRLYFEKLKN